jgi:ornithine--oxo-acid transaminase
VIICLEPGTVHLLIPKSYMVFSPEELAEASKALSDVLEHDLPQLQLQKQIKKPESEAEKPVCDRCGRDLYG